ncbi:Major facilitator superfamily domain containing protein [Rhypophila sp. PSN 637]
MTNPTKALVVLAKLAAFTDAFLSGLLIPLVPTIIRERTGVHEEQIQIWTSVFIAAYGGAFVAASPFLPLFWHKRSSIWASLSCGLALAAASFVLLQVSTGITSLVLARALHGFSGVLITGASAGLMSISARINRDANPLSWMPTPFIQGVAMVVGPAAGSVLYSRLGGLATVFNYAYAALALTALIVLVGFKLYGKGVGAGNRAEQRRLLGSEGSGYGTVVAQQRDDTEEAASTPNSTGSIIALGGCIMVTLFLAALQSVLPIWAGKTFHWPVSKTGFLLVHLFVPATVVGLVTGSIVNQAPRSARFVAALGFLICLAAFWYLGNLPDDINAAKTHLLETLSVISLGIGFTAGPLFGSATPASSRGMSMTSRQRARAAVQNTSIPSIASAWGILIGPLAAGSVRSGWGWETLTQLLATLSASSAILVLLFLNGWIGSRQPRTNTRSVAGDEESGEALLAAAAATNTARSDKIGGGAAGGGYSSERTVGTDDSQSPDYTKALKTHRRHFSADNFSIASTNAGGETVEISQVRVRASLESPITPGFNNTIDPASRRSSRGSSINTERRFLMREAPHAPATDPLLAAGNRYVIDESGPAPESGSEHPTAPKKRHVVVFPEEDVSPELLKRRKHHVVSINSLDGSFELVKNKPNPGTDSVGLRIEEEMAPEQENDEVAKSPRTSSPDAGEKRRYVVFVLEDGETGIDPSGEH